MQKESFLSFQINEVHLAMYSLSSYGRKGPLGKGQYFLTLEKYRNLAKKMSLKNFNLVNDKMLFLNPNYFDLNNIKFLDEDLHDYLNQLITTQEYVNLFGNTLEALKKVRDEWFINLKKTKSLMEKVTGINFVESLRVFITHPAQRQGRYLGKGIIAWTYRNDWPNYNTIYLWHEILHHYQPLETESDLTCSLLADHWLKFQLNSNGEIGNFEGKPNQLMNIKEIYPRFQNYLSTVNDKGNIIDIRNLFKQISL